MNNMLSLITAIRLLLNAHKKLWPGFICLLVATGMLLSFILYLQQQSSKQELAGRGLVSDAYLEIVSSHLTATKANALAQAINSKYQALVVPVANTVDLSCRFYVSVSERKKVSKIVNGKVIKRYRHVASWVPSGEYNIELNELLLDATRIQLSAFFQGKSIGNYELNSISEETLSVSLLNSAHEFLDGDHYFFSHINMQKQLIGPYVFDEQDARFYLVDEDELEESDSGISALAKLSHNQLILEINRANMPFVSGVQFEQMTETDFEYTNGQSNVNNATLLAGLSFNGDNERAKGMISDPLFRKIFGHNFDYKKVKIDCSSETLNFNQEFTAWGHYDYQTDLTHNPNQMFLSQGYTKLSHGGVNRFLLKDLGQLTAAKNALEKQLSLLGINQVSFVESQTNLTSLWAARLLLALIVLTITLMFFALALPFRRVLSKELFLIKIFGGKPHLALILSCLFIYFVSSLVCILVGKLTLHYMNHAVLIYFNVPLMVFDTQLLISGLALNFIAWMAVWSLLTVTLNSSIMQQGASRGD
ncbi:hypothetical protein CXF85_11185 [Colwellia sp. 75C3]|uniref:hypothetical protein n=1 Tax=Colwellia sp. 75C3 TaxID=888425 RepID=UPI000C3248D7|nr:hypothetical protein [Colwellia sp. 75C3]PKG83286.1 hypothetical protein CXF85_11185 [Colwellia sp. 75C3]